MKTALLLIDIQKGLDEWSYYGEERSNPQAEKNCERVLDFYRKHNLPVYHVCNDSINPASPLHASKPGNEIKEPVKPLLCEPLYRKQTNSAFIGTKLESDLRSANIEQLVVIGLTAEHCISSSVRMAANLGFKIILLSDATAAFSKQTLAGDMIPASHVHEVTLANLKDEYATILSTEAYLQNAASSDL